jgi:hypothetical protein
MMLAVGFPAEPETGTSVRAYGRQTCQPFATCAAAARVAVRPRRSRSSFALMPLLRRFLICRLVATISMPPRRWPSVMSNPRRLSSRSCLTPRAFAL